MLARLVDLQQKVCRQTELPDVPALRLFCVSARGDEARAILDIARDIGDFFVFFSSSGVVLTLLLVGLFAWAGATVGLDGMMPVLILMVVASVFPIVVAIQLFLTTSVLRYSVRVAFGEAAGLHGLLVEVNVSPTPSDRLHATCRTYDLHRRLWQFRKPLAHSLTYADPAIARDVIDFVFGASKPT
jgi:hypothetical protein